MFMHWVDRKQLLVCVCEMSLQNQNNDHETPGEAITGSSNGLRICLDTGFDASIAWLQRSKCSFQNFSNTFV